MASATAILNRLGVTEIYIGGAGDTRTRLVATFAETRQRMFAHDAHRKAHYFPHYAPRRCLKCARQAVAAGRRLLIVGHSWGGDTALRVLRSLNPEFVDLLVCVDPVPKSRLNPPPTPRNSQAHHPCRCAANPPKPVRQRERSRPVDRGHTAPAPCNCAHSNRRRPEPFCICANDGLPG